VSGFLGEVYKKNSRFTFAPFKKEKVLAASDKKKLTKVKSNGGLDKSLSWLKKKKKKKVGLKAMGLDKGG
jgi:hypothetical protein